MTLKMVLAEIIGKKVHAGYHLGKGRRAPSILGDFLADLYLAPRQVFFMDDLDSIVGRQILEH